MDDEGRTLAIVDFTTSAHETYPLSISGNAAWIANLHKPQALNLVANFEQRYGFQRTGMTSWVGNSVTAYLSQAQIDALREDQLVTKISAVAQVWTSSQPSWSDTTAGSETQSWGWNAVGGQVASSSSRRVYVIDTGVADHDDLNLMGQVSIACGGAIDCGNDPIDYAYVGCYAHATHVAGIVGAKVNGSNITTAGIYANVGIYSVGVRTKYFPAGDCGNVDTTGAASSTDRIGYALDYIYRDVLINGSGDVAIVNMSMNPGAVGFEPSGGTWVSQTNYSKVMALVTPTSGVYDPITNSYYNYPGAFFVQSAGNDDSEVCGSAIASRAFTPYATFIPPWFPPNFSADVSDGVMVVAAINSNGDTINSGISSFPALPFSATTPAGLSGTPSASNYGACVDAWAPGDNIVSTWGDHSSPNTEYGVPPYSGNPSSGSSGWAFLSGTSMAAPHIAGAAAYLADSQSLATPSAIEQAVRSKFVQLKSADSVTPSAFYDTSGMTYVRDRAALLINMPQLP